jgi:hypothetical protein
MLVLFALLAAAMVFAQTPAGATSGNPPTTPQTQTPTAPNNGTTATPGSATSENTQVNGGQSNQTPNTGTYPQPANPQSTNPGGNNGSTANSAGVNNQNNSAAPQGQTAGNSTQDQIAAGTEIHATLDTPLSTKTSKPGDRFTATISDPVRGSNGGMVVPAGTRLEGEVSEAEEGKTVAALRGKGKLSLRFRDVVLPSGQTLPVTATLISVNDTNGKNTKKADEEGQVQSGTRNKDVAKDVGIGAGIGTVAGLIFGGPLKGLAIGAIAGGGYVLATKGKDVNLPAQTGMVIRLDQPVSTNGNPPQR